MNARGRAHGWWLSHLFSVYVVIYNMTHVVELCYVANTALQLSLMFGMNIFDYMSYLQIQYIVSLECSDISNVVIYTYHPSKKCDLKSYFTSYNSLNKNNSFT